MTPEQEQQIEELYAEATKLDPVDRPAFVLSSTQGDEVIRRELETLVQHGDTAGDFLEISALDLMATVISEDQRKMVGRRVGNYEILSLIGRGGMGEVWRARDIKLGREVAIKMLPEEFSSDRVRMARLEREAQVLASLNHPGIASIYGFEEAEDMSYLVLEFVEGETLADRLKQAVIPVEESLRLVIQVAEALEVAHETGVIHRDLKPANIVVKKDGKTKLLDFGLAKALEGPAAVVNLANSSTPTVGTGLSVDGMILGTAPYMSPEQARGVDVDKRADIWALGCVLYELLTGRRAFDGENTSDVMASVLAREPDDTLLDRYHPALKRLVRRCLEKESSQRFRDAGDVRIELAHLLSRPPGTILQPSHPHRSTWQILGWVASVVVVSSVIAMGVGWYVQDRTPPSLARFVVSASPSEPVRLSGLTTDLDLSPDGQTVAYSVDVDGRRGIYVRPINQLEGHLLIADAVDTPFFSPDSLSIGFSALADGTLKQMPIGGGMAETITDLPGAVRGASWGPNDTIVFATVDASTGLFRVPTSGGDPEVLTTPMAGENHFWPEILPDGNAVLFTIRSGLGSENSQIAVLDLSTLTYEVLINGASQARYASTGHIVYGVEGRLHAVRFDPDTLSLSGGDALVLDGVVPTAAGAVPFGLSDGLSANDNGSLAYVGGAPLENNRVLALVDREGVIDVLDLPPMPYLSPRLSPDGNRLAVQVNEEGRNSIWVYEMSGDTQIRPLTSNGNSIRPVWSADSERVTFASDQDGQWGIYWQPADGSSVAQRLTTAQEGRQHWPESWSPDGSTLSFAVVDGEARGLWLLSMAGGEIRTELFYDAVGFHQNGSLFSPDGNWLAYYSNESNSDNQIYVQSVPPSGVQHQITLDGGVFPLWSADGDELIYRRPGTAAIDGTRLISVELTGDDTVTPGPERLLPVSGFSVVGAYRDYDITSDGERFLMVFSQDYAAPAGAPRRQVNVVTHWFEELADRVPVR